MTLSLLVSEVKCLISSPFCNEKFQIKKVYTGLNGKIVKLQSLLKMIVLHMLIGRLYCVVQSVF